MLLAVAAGSMGTGLICTDALEGAMTPKHIKTIRAWLELSQAELAEQIGVSPNTVARWEMGIRRPGGAAMLCLVGLWQRVQGELSATQAA